MKKFKEDIILKKNRNNFILLKSKQTIIIVKIIFIIYLQSCTTSETYDIFDDKNFNVANSFLATYNFFLKDFNTDPARGLRPLPFEFKLPDKKFFSASEVRNYLFNEGLYNDLFTFDTLIFPNQTKNNAKLYDNPNKFIEIDLGKYENKIMGDSFVYFINKEELKNIQQGSIAIIAEEMEKEINGTGESLASLIFSPKFNSKFNDSTLIPEYLKSELSIALKETVNFLPDSLISRILNIHFSFSKKNSYLWVSSNHSSNSISISPYLIRAVFFLVINDYASSFAVYKTMKKRYGEMIDKRSDLGEENSIEILNNQLMELATSLGMLDRKFRTYFYFIIGHEIAHLYLNIPSSDSNIEDICDCYSLKYLKKSGEYSLGLYEDLLESCMKSGYDSLWGVTNKGDLLKRITKVKDLSNSENNVECPIVK